MALGDNIKRLREERQLTQQMLADKLYVSRQTVCRWENGTRCPDLIMAKKLAVELNISLDELISDEDVDQFTKKGFPFHSDKVKERKALEERQKRVRCDISSDLCILPDTIGDACSHVVLHPRIMSGSCSFYCEVSDSQKVESVILSG